MFSGGTRATDRNEDPHTGKQRLRGSIVLSLQGLACRKTLESVVRYGEVRVALSDRVGEIGLGVAAGARASYRDDDLLIGGEGCCCRVVEGREERGVDGEEGRDGGDGGETRS